MARPCGPMDKASDFESEDCGFDPHHGQPVGGFVLELHFNLDFSEINNHRLSLELRRI